MAEPPNPFEQEMNVPRPVTILLGLVLVLGGIFVAAFVLYSTRTFLGARRPSTGGMVVLFILTFGVSALMLHVGYRLLRMKESTDRLWSPASMAKYGGWSFVALGVWGIGCGIASLFLDFESHGEQWQDIVGGLALSAFGYRWSQSRKAERGTGSI
jgi:apolipoprotein N-acyltransferase